MADAVQLHHGDALAVLRTLPDHSVAAVVTDPPYELGFMSKCWDATGIAFRPDVWRELRRVATPGAHLVAFGGTRTWHRMTCAIEDAGWEIRNTVCWLHGQGFPKSKNLGGDWEGWGTDLKPGFEPIVLARAPLSEPTVAANVAKHSTGAININACRIRATVTANVVEYPTEGMLSDESRSSEVSQPTPNGNGNGPARMSDVRGTVSSTKGRRRAYQGQDLQPCLPFDGDESGTECTLEWRQAEGVGPIHSGADSEWVCAGTSASNRASVGQAVTTNGSSASPERGHDGQSPREPNGVRQPGHARSGESLQSRPADGAPQALGRWPANVVLSHSDGCEPVGTRRVRGAGWRDTDLGGKSRGGLLNGITERREQREDHYAAPDGTELVEAWACDPTCPVRLLDEQSGERQSGKMRVRNGLAQPQFMPGWSGERAESETYGDTGGASRFYYCAKASTAERNAGLAGLPAVASRRYGERQQGALPQQTPQSDVYHRNHHPTVKPLALMRWLITLITPPDGTVLDPFAGSGSTLVAARDLGVPCIGIEQDAAYVALAAARLGLPAPVVVEA